MFNEKTASTKLSQIVPNFPSTLIMLGTGWNKVLEKVKVEVEIPYDQLFGVSASVPGHAGKLVIGQLNGQRIACMAGRMHMYEGYSAHEATLPVRVFAAAGMKRMVVTSASGAINEKYKVGDFIILSDIITLLLSLDSPLIGPKFVDMSEAFNQELRGRAIEVCVTHQLPFHEGIYCYYHGPSFETPADKMAIKILGADVVGMSTVPETITARSLGVNVLGLSFVTNLAFVKHAHEDVLAAANQSSRQMVALLEGILKDTK